ncbi:MAG: hypothetical protein HC912_10780, partial [Saprospiraceae bacterium]|nr:hypothetical protein [Saprospiraceae bacterium]
MDELLVERNITIEELMSTNVTTMSRTGNQKTTEAPATILTITADQISRRNYQSLAELLQDLPDVKIDHLSDPRWLND